MKSGIFVNLLQSIFAIKTVYSVKNQKPAEFLNSCLLLFGVVTVGMILYRNGLKTILERILLNKFHYLKYSKDINKINQTIEIDV